MHQLDWRTLAFNFWFDFLLFVSSIFWCCRIWIFALMDRWQSSDAKKRTMIISYNMKFCFICSNRLNSSMIIKNERTKQHAAKNVCFAYCQCHHRSILMLSHMGKMVYHICHQNRKQLSNFSNYGFSSNHRSQFCSKQWYIHILHKLQGKHWKRSGTGKFSFGWSVVLFHCLFQDWIQIYINGWDVFPPTAVVVLHRCPQESQIFTTAEYPGIKICSVQKVRLTWQIMIDFLVHRYGLWLIMLLVVIQFKFTQSRVLHNSIPDITRTKFADITMNKRYSLLRHNCYILNVVKMFKPLHYKQRLWKIEICS